VGRVDAQPRARAAALDLRGGARVGLAVALGAALISSLACAPVEVPWTRGGLAPTGAADRRVADLAELWIAAAATSTAARVRAADHTLGELRRLPVGALSRSFALDARVLAHDAQRYRARAASAVASFEVDRGAPLAGPEDLAELRACLARVLSSTTTLAACAGAGEPRPASALPTLADLIERAQTSPDAASPIRQATADARVVAAWGLVLDDVAAAAGTSSTARARVEGRVRPALAELGRYAPRDAAWTLLAALELLAVEPSRLAARLERHADQGLISPWLLDPAAAEHE
jgi:hypothetical protein